MGTVTKLHPRLLSERRRLRVGGVSLLRRLLTHPALIAIAATRDRVHGQRRQRAVAHRPIRVRRSLSASRRRRTASARTGLRSRPSSLSCVGPMGPASAACRCACKSPLAASVQDFGTLSAKSIATGLQRRATAVYTAPPAPPPPANRSSSRRHDRRHADWFELPDGGLADGRHPPRSDGRDPAAGRDADPGVHRQAGAGDRQCSGHVRRIDQLRDIRSLHEHSRHHELPVELRRRHDRDRPDRDQDLHDRWHVCE